MDGTVGADDAALPPAESGHPPEPGPVRRPRVGLGVLAVGALLFLGAVASLFLGTDMDPELRIKAWGLGLTLIFIGGIVTAFERARERGAPANASRRLLLGRRLVQAAALVFAFGALMLVLALVGILPYGGPSLLDLLPWWLGLAAVLLLAGTAVRLAPGVAPMDPPRRRQTALAALVAGGVLLAIFYFALPTVHGPGCGPEGASGLASGWTAVRPPQMDPAVVGYDEGNHTTYIVPGCGHGSTTALRVRGDHRDAFQGYGDRMVLAPEDVDGTVEALPASMRMENGTCPEYSECATSVVRGTFVQKDLSWHFTSFTAGATLTAIGLGLARSGVSWPWGLGPAVATAAAVLFVFWGYSEGAGSLDLFLFGFAWVGLPLVVGGIGLAASRGPRLAMVFWALLAWCLAYEFAVFSFDAFFPTEPTA